MKGKLAKINKIIQQFDFRVVKDFLLANNITWEADGVEYIPSIMEIRAKALQMLKAAADSNTGYYKASLAGLTVRKTSVSLELSYVIEIKSA